MTGRVLTGKHFLKGDYAISEGAMAAGLNFFAGYPITPASPVAERISIRSLDIEDLEYIQMEDEIASMAALIGGSVTGAKNMTATSGPGLSLMLENIGLAYMFEVPALIINVMRGGPSTGMPTLTSQGDIMQARWGSHGDINMIAYAPANTQEYFDLTIDAMNAAEKYRTPVILLADQVTGLMSGVVEIPDENDIKIVNRKLVPNGLENYKPYEDVDGDAIPPMALAGQGYAVHMTGLTHDERGYPSATPPTQAKLMKRLLRKFEENIDDMVDYEEFEMDDAEVAIVCYGTESRAVKTAVIRARRNGLKFGMFRMKVLWPFHNELFVKLADRVKKIIVSEGNMGQYIHPVRAALYDTDAKAYSLIHYGGQIHTPEEVLNFAKEVLEK
jgi:2-oxoglutarate ferredoxin oxidoreductase subunit alpha